ncbi:MAG: hypothetical protein CR993_08015 [Rhodobacterales bacterium]|nr:MAG: hypothetical protein CR993_08015 [Rhodobacterales bacterium]
MTPHRAKRSQYLTYLRVSLIVALLGIVLYYLDASTFGRFLGTLNPLITILVSILTGALLLYYLMEKAQFVVHQPSPFRTHLILIGIAFLFGFEVVIADIWFLDYPADINIPFPKSLLFYPTIGFIAEVFFHLLPLTIGIFVLSQFANLSQSKIVWISILLVAILEPGYQMWFARQNSAATMIYTGVHVFLFSLTQLVILKRFGFVSMYAFRLGFYAIWHVVWGALRLDVLF